MLVIKNMNFTVVIFISLAIFSCRPGSTKKTPVIGEYYGSVNGIDEILSLDGKGGFVHKVTSAKGQLINESGSYKDTGNGVELENFTQFYDTATERMTDTGKPFVGYEFYYFQSGKLEILKAEPNQEFYLKKKK